MKSANTSTVEVFHMYIVNYVVEAPLLKIHRNKSTFIAFTCYI